MFFLYILLSLLLIEICFRIYHRKKYGRPYHVSIKFNWNRSHVIPHPYLHFAYKRNEVIDKNQPIPYPIHTNEFYSFKEPLRLNNFGHFGDDFSYEKKENTIRIACLGASTTANNIADGEKDYSYPKLLEEELNSKSPDQHYEVYNCGIGGWQTPDIMINFLLKILPLKPDQVIIYHAYNDLRSYLTDDFEPDYSHSTKNLGEELHKIKRSYYFPKIKFWHSYECLKDKLLGTGNVRNDVGHVTVKDTPDIANDYHNLAVENDLIKNIIIICQHYGIKVILGSFAHYKYNNDPVHDKYREGVAIENQLRHELAEEFALPFVDIDSIMPREDKYFVDALHFTPDGMKVMAKEFADAIYKKDLAMSTDTYASE